MHQLPNSVCTPSEHSHHPTAGGTIPPVAEPARTEEPLDQLELQLHDTAPPALWSRPHHRDPHDGLSDSPPPLTGAAAAREHWTRLDDRTDTGALHWGPEPDYYPGRRALRYGRVLAAFTATTQGDKIDDQHAPRLTTAQVADLTGLSLTSGLRRTLSDMVKDGLLERLPSGRYRVRLTARRYHPVPLAAPTALAGLGLTAAAMNAFMELAAITRRGAVTAEEYSARLDLDRDQRRRLVDHLTALTAAGIVRRIEDRTGITYAPRWALFARHCDADPIDAEELRLRAAMTDEDLFAHLDQHLDQHRRTGAIRAEQLTVDVANDCAQPTPPAPVLSRKPPASVAKTAHAPSSTCARDEISPLPPITASRRAPVPHRTPRRKEPPVLAVHLVDQLAATGVLRADEAHRDPSGARGLVETLRRAGITDPTTAIDLTAAAIDRGPLEDADRPLAVIAHRIRTSPPPAASTVRGPRASTRPPEEAPHPLTPPSEATQRLDLERQRAQAEEDLSRARRQGDPPDLIEVLEADVDALTQQLADLTPDHGTLADQGARP